MVIHDGREKRFLEDCLVFENDNMPRVWERQCLIAIFRRLPKHRWPAMLRTENYRVSAIAEATLASDAPHRELPSFGDCRKNYATSKQTSNELHSGRMRAFPCVIFCIMSMLIHAISIISCVCLSVDFTYILLPRYIIFPSRPLWGALQHH